MFKRLDFRKEYWRFFELLMFPVAIAIGFFVVYQQFYTNYISLSTKSQKYSFLFCMFEYSKNLLQSR